MRLFNIAGDSGAYVELGAPLKVYYDITNKCNLDCVFCFKENKENGISWNQARSVIQKVADANIPDLVFIGGEPMCCPFLFDALEYAKELGINPGIVTNGTLFTDENAKKLKRLVNNSISVSVHAPNDELHDQLSNGNRVYTRIVEGLKILNANDIVPELAFTPVKDNIPFLFETIDSIFSSGIKISDVLVNRLIPYGNALLNWRAKEVDIAGQLSLLEQMDRLYQKYHALYPEFKISSGDALPFCVIEEKYRKYIARCDYAITLGWINEHNLFGKCMVRGCTSADSIDDHSLRSLWQASEAFLCHRHMKNLTNECQDCDWLLECGGGCACSGKGTTEQDVFLSSGIRYPLPPHKPREPSDLVATIEEIGRINNQDVYTIEKHFIIRKEHKDNDILDCVFLFIPAGSGAIIQDIITPEKGQILWINAVEKQIIVYLQAALRVAEIAKSISYEFNLPINSAVDEVKRTVALLSRLGMVEQK